MTENSHVFVFLERRGSEVLRKNTRFHSFTARRSTMFFVDSTTWLMLFFIVISLLKNATGCPENCERCDDITSNCHGCSQGFRGPRCNETCPIQCLDNVCDQSAVCTKGCKPGWSGTYWCQCKGNLDRDGSCEKCAVGWFRQDCFLHCNLNCLEDECEQMNGTCSRGCKPGWFGEDCSSKCPLHCRGDVCNGESGTCLRGCDTGWIGDHCQCYRDCGFFGCNNINGLCSECAGGWFESDCSSRCPEICFGPCTQFNGSCTHCPVGYYGHHCDMPCFQTCIQCDRRSGNCLQCVKGKTGSDCTRNCSIACRDDVCYANGTCLNGCILGFEGDSCDQISREFLRYILFALQELSA
ncbi:scavenger receptor class F member 1-like [Argopecten irradians]|uniref:scavenger receptor class F member 1-like n=1 Tax=Argopecten irradians TaxID=31199 RepID=UPI00371BBB17